MRTREVSDDSAVYAPDGITDTDLSRSTTHSANVVRDRRPGTRGRREPPGRRSGFGGVLLTGGASGHQSIDWTFSKRSQRGSHPRTLQGHPSAYHLIWYTRSPGRSRDIGSSRALCTTCHSLCGTGVFPGQALFTYPPYHLYQEIEIRYTRREIGEQPDEVWPERAVRITSRTRSLCKRPERRGTRGPSPGNARRPGKTSYHAGAPRGTADAEESFAARVFSQFRAIHGAVPRDVVQLATR